MQTPTAEQLLDLWDRGQAWTPAQRALALLAAAFGDQAPAAMLPAGARDARLLDLRDRLFGPLPDGVTACPACGERLELALPIAHLRESVEPAPGERYELALDGYQLWYRLPTAGDLASLDRSAGRGAMALSRRCVLDARHNGAPLAVELLPEELIAALGEQVAQRDPLADVWLELGCPDCAYRWQLAFDAASWVWRELDDWAERVLADVHLLASAYGWSESQILALSPRRRRRYLELLGV